MAVRAPSLENSDWLNHKALSKKDLEGKIVLLDFFTYCCMNCINVLEELKSLETEFNQELLVIGIHSGKHKHEKDETSIRQALRRYKIEHIVINDADMKLWDEYGIKAWPSLVLIDTKGYIVSTYQGEGHLSDLRNDILSLQSSSVTRHDFLPTLEEPHKNTLTFPKKIYCAKEYLFISTLDEVLVCSYEGIVLHKITHLNAPQGMVYANEALYICERGAHCITEVSEAFTCKRKYLQGLRNPNDIEFKDGVLYVALAGAHQIKGYNLNTKEEVLVIGNENSESLHDASFSEAVLAQPSGLCLLEDELWFVDSESSSLRCASYHQVHSHIYDNDALQHPLDLCVGQYGDGCGGGRIFIVDSYNNAVKVYNPQTQELSLLLQDLNEPSGIDKKACDLYICNTNKHEIIIFDLSKMQSRLLMLKELT